MPLPLAELLGALTEPVVDPASRTWWGGLLGFVVVAGLFGLIRRPGWSVAGAVRALRHPSSRLDLQLYLSRQVLRWLAGAGGVAGAWWVATRLVRQLDGAVGVPAIPALPSGVVMASYSVALFVAWDLSRYVLHALMHRVPGLWAVHQVHHSARVLTPLTFHRIHPLESLLYQARGALVTGGIAGLFFWLFREQATAATLIGVPAAGLLLNVLFGNLRHSHVWLRFPSPVERWLLSPAQHQLHHSADPAHFDSNYGTWLAVWDRVAGTLMVSPASPPRAFGIAEGERNHGDDLLSAWFGPLRSSRLATVIVSGLVLLTFGRVAWAGDEADPGTEASASGEETDAEDDRPRYGTEILVTADGETPRVAGSAHEVSRDVLEQFEYDDVERVLSTTVPGVTTRGEDGFGLRPNIGIRGANSDRSAKITLMEDGVLFAPAPYAAPAAYYFPMSTRLVGIEVFKGAAATRYGPNTVGGAINLLTRSTPAEGVVWGLDVAGGLRETAKGHGFVGVGGATAGVLAEVVHVRTAGFKTIDTPVAADAGRTGFDRTDAMLKGRWTPSTDHQLQLKLGYGREESDETYLGLTLADWGADAYRRYAGSQSALMRWERTQAELRWQARLSDAVQVDTVAYHHYLTRQWTKLNGFRSGPDLHTLLTQAPDAGQAAVFLAVLRGEEDTATADQQLMVGTNDRRYHAFGVQSAARWEVNTNKVGSTFEAGARVHGDIVDRLHTEDPHEMRSGRLRDSGDPDETTVDSRADADALALFMHEDLRLGTVHILPGARLETVRNQLVVAEDRAGVVTTDPDPPVTRTVLLPGLGLLAGVGEHVDVFAGAYRGFSPVAPGQPAEVAPELSWNTEAGVRAGDEFLHGELVGFFNDYENISGACTFSGGCTDDQVGQQFNGGAVHVAGLEAVSGVDVLLPGPFTLPVEATYTWTWSAFQTGFVSGFPQFGTVEIGDRLPYVPEHQGSARVTLRHPRFDIGSAVSARSEMLDEAGTFPGGELDIPALVLLDAIARVRVSERALVYATGSNLTRQDAITSWRPYGARPTAPLQVMVGLKVGPPVPIE
ncbi:MAG: TonB-dependent receptor [Myxococcota bacterium]|nr:TonB-dependent receptor [Myxococcota bacterium]